MRKQNGMTIIEVLLSVVIIGIVLLLLFSLLIQVKNEDNENNIQSNFIINQSTFIKEMEEDITNYGVKYIAPCDSSDLNLTNNNSAGTATMASDKHMCLKIKYNVDTQILPDNIGYLIVYKYFTTYDVVNGKYVGKDSSWMIEYQRGSYKDGGNKSTWKATKTIMKEIPDDIDLTDHMYSNFSAMPNSRNAASIVMPIVTAAGDHYDINLSFLFEGETFACYYGTTGAGILDCNCLTNQDTCSNFKKDIQIGVLD